MNKKSRLWIVIAALILAQLACNLPNQSSQPVSNVPAPEMTLTALFAVTPAEASPTSTVTLPPVFTATPSAGGEDMSSPTNPPAPTDTQVPPSPIPNPTASNPLPTAHPILTNTPGVIHPTATIPFTRPRGGVVANYLSTPPTLDGDWGEWKDLTKEYPANFVTWGKENWTGADDLSSSFHVGWDNNNLYVAVKVHDDRYVQNASGANIYKGDSLEILFDNQLQTDYYYSQLSPDDFQLGISPGRPDPDGTREAYLWFPSNVAGARASVKIGSRLEDGIYRVEAAIPWSVLEVTPAANRHYGFVLSVSDNDDPNANVQQSLVSNVSTRRLTDPTTWGDLQLVK